MKRDRVASYWCGHNEIAFWLERVHPVVGDYRWPVCVEWDECDGYIEDVRAHVIGSRGRFAPIELTPSERSRIEARIYRRMESDDGEARYSAAQSAWEDAAYFWRGEP